MTTAVHLPPWSAEARRLTPKNTSWNRQLWPKPRHLVRTSVMKNCFCGFHTRQRSSMCRLSQRKITKANIRNPGNSYVYSSLRFSHYHWLISALQYADE